MPENLNEAFAARLRLGLAEKGISRAELARRTSLSSTAVSLMARGDYIASAATLCQIADALEVSVDWLLGRTEREDKRHVEDQLSRIKRQVGVVRRAIAEFDKGDEE